jgi:uncharacterized membrane protein
MKPGWLEMDESFRGLLAQVIGALAGTNGGAPARTANPGV